MPVWHRPPSGWLRPPNPFRDAVLRDNIRCANCGGTSQEHDRLGYCIRLKRDDKRHGQLESLR